MIWRFVHWIAARVGCSHRWDITARSYDCVVERCSKCGSERYFIIGESYTDEHIETTGH